jgi:prepilin-type N-terminal cleavage/methylation domain-containing protein
MNTKIVKKQGGFTLIEVVVGLIIFGIIAAALSPILFGARDDTLVSTESTAMSRSVTNLESRYDTEAWGSAIDNAEMIAGRLISENYKFIEATDTIYNQFGGEITVTGVDFNGLTWESEKIPAGSCASMVAEVKNLTIFEQVDIGSTNLQYSDTGNADYTAACEAEAGTGDSVTITWTKVEA